MSFSLLWREKALNPMREGGRSQKSECGASRSQKIAPMREGRAFAEERVRSLAVPEDYSYARGRGAFAAAAGENAAIAAATENIAIAAAAPALSDSHPASIGILARNARA